MKRQYLWILLVLPLFSYAAEVIDTIQLQHRVAEDILVDIQPFLPDSATATAADDLIIIKADDATIKNIHRLISKLDKPLQRIKLSVLLTEQKLTTTQLSQLNGRIIVDNEAIQGHASLHNWSTQGNKEGKQLFQASGISHRPIQISLGKLIPQRDNYLVFTHNGYPAAYSTTHYLNINSGFVAIARLLPKQQTVIEIHPTFQQQTQDELVTIEHSQVFTTLSGPVGHWIELGQINHDYDLEQQGLTRYGTRQQTQQSIYIKLDQIH
mgnify:CR=1 FL=1